MQHRIHAFLHTRIAQHLGFPPEQLAKIQQFHNDAQSFLNEEGSDDPASTQRQRDLPRTEAELLDLLSERHPVR